ncbi:cytochrome P450 [Glonium stellatum]|uniref:Cytochrome P450 n=1 Tax=Glonium stellatum TaxID=574774 RepID=A0A8E2EVQ5_9PEZI|nr:cytochrome P450 [Glonium stellatum]
MPQTLSRFFGIKKDGSEPPFVPQTIPCFGHLIGVMFNRTSYYAKLRAKYGYPIFSLAMPGGRLYIINSPELILAVQKQPRTLSFWFIEASVTKRLGGISDRANKILLENARGEKGENSLVVDGMKATHKAMMADGLDSMTLVSIRRAAQSIDGLEVGNSGKELDLWKWVRHIFSLAVTAGVYGPKSPYEDVSLEQNLQDYASQTLVFLTGLAPSLLVPKAYAARERIVAGFENYFRENSFDSGSELVRARLRVLQAYGIQPQDIARFETVNGFGILLNLLPTAFWTIWHIFSDPNLLQDAQEEARLFLSNPNWASSDSKAEDLMPIVASTMKESLRYHVSGAATRMVMEDYTLNNQYLLKKDTMVLMPNSVPHFDFENWGPNADKFDAYRFSKQEPKRIHPAAFRSFGGGANLCPGRLYSTRLILAVTAMLVLRYDMSPLTSSGTWDFPSHDESNAAIVVAQPKRKTMVKLKSIGGFQSSLQSLVI